VEFVRRIGRDVSGLANSQERFCTAESDLDLALNDTEHFLEVVAMRRRATAGRHKHVDEAVTAGCVLARQKNRVGISNQSNVRQVWVFIGPYKR